MAKWNLGKAQIKTKQVSGCSLACFVGDLIYLEGC